ncbi:glycoside hydrolase family 125 protein [Paenibacillus lautus]|uniref:glycoside hydrolase family 125 protein n=1 Tax=Paenibacillus lautus TaxID=1401 RepID=UPI001C10B182|nr:glycoside hydrolase family 125 protein [Paenibacillus lautus]MBU5348759.1 glycoside hydrolase family 125 protein [Paenibacillus lautus]
MYTLDYFSVLHDLNRTIIEGTSAYPKLGHMFRNMLDNTLSSTIQRQPDGTTFVITGDIPAMWLRDSAAQIRPFLVPAGQDDNLADLIEGLVRRQTAFILLDPYANAFNDSPSGQGHQNDRTAMNPWLWERKYEIDSLCYPLQLAYLLWKETGRTSHLDQTFHSAARVILDIWRTEQHHETDSPYFFERFDCPPSDTLPRGGKGAEVAYTGMTWSGFRPSDDACAYGYLIPSNMFAVVVLGYLAEICREVLRDSELEAEAEKLADEIRHGIASYGVVDHPEYGNIYAYETDGMGNHLLMDDANVPSLLSIPYLGYTSADDPVYQNTRRFVLSRANPYYYQGTAAAGVGSPHTPDRYIWPIALAIQGLTTTDREEKLRLLRLMAETDAGTGMMHEGFLVDDPARYTRPWFSWANMMFCELMMDYCGIRVKANGIGGGRRDHHGNQ